MSFEMFVLLAAVAAVGGFAGWMASYLGLALGRGVGGIFASRTSLCLVTLFAAAFVGFDALQLFGEWPPALAAAAGCLTVGLVNLPARWAQICIGLFETLLFRRHNGKSVWPEAQRKAARISYDTAKLCFRNKLYKLSAQAAQEGMRTLLEPQLDYGPRKTERKRKARKTECPEEFKPHNRIAKYL